MSAEAAAGPVAAPAAPAPAGEAASFFRRQLVLAAVAGVVVLVALVGVVTVVDQGREAAHAALRPAPDGSGVRPVSPLDESLRSATWAVVLALVAVAVVLTMAVEHMLRVARFAVLSRPAGGNRADAAVEAEQEDR